MKYVGIDLHKKTISGCVVVKERGKRKIAARKRLECRDEAGIKSWFKDLGKFEVVVEATASYEWFVKLGGTVRTVLDEEYQLVTKKE